MPEAGAKMGLTHFAEAGAKMELKNFAEAGAKMGLQYFARSRGKNGVKILSAKTLSAFCDSAVRQWCAYLSPIEYFQPHF